MLSLTVDVDGVGVGARFPLNDGIGTCRRLVTGGNTHWDRYALDAFGRDLGSVINYHNPYRFGGAWGYITDPSGMLQLGARFYWPEIGRFVQQDPIGDGLNWYLYGYGNPVVWIDPYGLEPWNDWGDFSDWYMGGMGGASEWVDNHVLGGSTRNYGNVAGLYDSDCATWMQLAGAGAYWGGRVAVTALIAEQAGVRIAARLNPYAQVTRWGRPGKWVMNGRPGWWNYRLARIPGHPPFGDNITVTVPRSLLRWPGAADEGGWFFGTWKGLWGQRIYTGPPFGVTPLGL